MGDLISLTSRNSRYGVAQSVCDARTWETFQAYAHATLYEDFIGPGHVVPVAGSASPGYPWVKKLVKTAGAPSVAVVAAAPGGIMRLSIDATSEKQEATLYADDALGWDATKCATFEARLACHTLPGTGVEIVFGLHSAWADGPDNIGKYIRFQQSASGAVNYQSKDGTTTPSNSAGVTLSADAFHLFRFDTTDPGYIRFIIDGIEVSTVIESFAATGANAVLQPYISIYKASGTGTGAVDIDAIRLSMNRS